MTSRRTTSPADGLFDMWPCCLDGPVAMAASAYPLLHHMATPQRVSPAHLGPTGSLAHVLKALALALAGVAVAVAVAVAVWQFRSADQ